jgi:hypothetical protein
MGLVRLATWFNQDRGVVTVCQLVVGDLQSHGADLNREINALNDALTSEGLAAFGEVDIVPAFEAGLIGVAQANGFAGLQANTVMFGWPNDERGLAMLLRVMRAVSRINKSTIIARMPKVQGLISRRRIDVWWGGLQHNGDLMLLLAHLLRLNPEWRQARITLRSIVSSEAEQEEMHQRIVQLVQEVRIEAGSDVIVKAPGSTVVEVMHRASRSADVVFLGLNIPAREEELEYAGRLFELAEGFPATIFVRNCEHFAGELI